MEKAKETASGSIKLPHTCPNCPEGKKTIATTYQEIDDKFGFRNMGDGTVRVQSWCRECRSKN